MPSRPQILDYEPLINVRGDSAGAGGEAPPDDAGQAGAGPSGARRDVRPSAAARSLLLRAESWGGRRGHAVSFAGLLVFTFILYFRPQDYFPSLAAAHIALAAAIFTLLAFIPSQLAAEGTLTARPREVNLVLLLCAAALLSVPLAIDPALAAVQLWESCIKSALTFILIVNIVRTERRLKVMLYLALAITLLLCLMALNDYRLGNLAVEGYRVEGKSTGGMFENTNDLGIHLVTVLPLAVALGLCRGGLLRRALFGACGALILATVVVTFSRGAFLGLLASGLLMAWQLGRRNRLAVFVALGVTALLALAFTPGEYWLRLASIFDSSLDRFGSSTARGELLKRSFTVALANPVFGVGIGNFTLTSARAQVTHNAYTQVAAEMGMAAALIYTMFIVAPLKRLQLIAREAFAARRSSQFYFLAVGLQASLVAYMVSSLFASVAFYLYVYYLVGYAVCLRRLYLLASEGGGGGAGQAPPV